ncbi:MAG: hypothetical protein IJC89_06135 [Clostridia bacterium]|nr:hypothetical protein [Clostridia bacterium]
MGKQHKKTHLMRRITETAVIEVISSVLIYLIVISDSIPDTIKSYVAIYTISALVFLALTGFVLKSHYRALYKRTKRYLKVNLSIFFIHGVFNIIGLKYFSDNLYTALFGYTKPLRPIFKMYNIPHGNVLSSMAFFGVYFLVIIGIAIWKCEKRKTKEEPPKTDNKVTDETSLENIEQTPVK